MELQKVVRFLASIPHANIIFSNHNLWMTAEGVCWNQSCSCRCRNHMLHKQSLTQLTDNLWVEVKEGKQTPPFTINIMHIFDFLKKDGRNLQTLIWQNLSHDHTFHSWWTGRGCSFHDLNTSTLNSFLWSLGA